MYPLELAVEAEQSQQYFEDVTMTKHHFFSIAILAGLLTTTLSAKADDIDLYSVSTGGSNTVPNLMFVIDSSANSDANFGDGTCTYYDGTAPSLTGSKVLGNEQCALVNVAHSLSTRSDGSALVNLGITQAKDGHWLDFTPIDDKPSPAADAAGKTNREYFIWKVQTYDKRTGFTVVAEQMQEAFAYMSGGNAGANGTANNVGSISNLTFTGGVLGSTCGGNFIVAIGASPSSAHTKNPSDDGAGLLDLPTAVRNDAANFSNVSTSALTATISDPNSKENPWGREWARFAYQRAQYGAPSIITYSINLLGSPSNTSMQTFWANMATYGGGKPFTAANYNDIVNSLLKILNEVQAVNSVFASASLPVSVNAQGTYLNQIYMGMFRPDANGLPRWLGNLKQYQFVYTPATSTTAATLTLSDSQPISAISNAGTGFISPNAISFWTSKNTGAVPDGSSGTYPGGGFWRNKPQGVGAGYDSPDGEVVEKGGVSQQIRKANLLNNYVSAAGTTGNPRNVATYCPAGGATCIPNLLDPSNLFTSSNVPSASFNSSNVSISSIVRTGNTALVTTRVAHGFTSGTAVTISGATSSDYNGTWTITTSDSTTFTITGVNDHPNSPSQATYTASIHPTGGVSISSITALPHGTVAGSYPCATANINCDVVTVTTSANHNFSVGSNVVISGVSPSNYGGTVTVASVPTSTTFTYSVQILPTSPSANSYSVQALPAQTSTITSIVTKNNKPTTFNVGGTNTFAVGDSVTISSTGGTCDGTLPVTSGGSNTFQVAKCGVACSSGNCGKVVKVSPSYPIAINNISRASATAALATVTGIPANVFTTNQTVNIIKTGGTSANESAYVQKSGTITCIGTTCTSFTFPIVTTSPTPDLTYSSATAALAPAGISIPAGAIQRTGTIVTVTVSNPFHSTDTIDIAVSGAANLNESAYVGTWTVQCSTNPCGSSFTLLEPVTLTPTSPAAGNMTASSGGAPPPEQNIVDWVRGSDNNGDEPSPDPTLSLINVRGSVHGDVLHSRPTVINYGGLYGTVVFYGSNDGMFRAVNGNQYKSNTNTGAITNSKSATGSTPAGGELWAFLAPEFIGSTTRLRDNSPMLLMPSTPAGITPAPTKKNYFFDGTASVYQKLSSTSPITTTEAYIYLSMRRGGNFIYALNVNNPTDPSFLWKISPGSVTLGTSTTASSDYDELGQTWSQPKVALLHGYVDASGMPKPVLIFGGGYDPAEDSEPPGIDSSGRGIFIVDAMTGSLIWSVTAGSSDACSTDASGTRCTKANMKWSIPSDVALIDANADGYVDRLYVGDTGGNIWRVDLEPNGYSSTASANLPSSWNATQLAALGCSAGMCTSGTPRKFFYPPDMVPGGNGFQAVLIGSGDREHPLYSASSNTSYSVTNRFYMIKDTNTGASGSDLITGTGANIETKLKNITPATGVTATTYDNTLNGYYLSMGTGEKVVNAPTTVAGYTYFATNTPVTPTTNSCSASLGVAKGYAVTPLTGTGGGTPFTYSGGGFPPTTVAGVVDVSYTDANGHAQTAQVPFCLGCGGNPNLTPTGGSAIAGSKPPITVPTNRTKRYWYIEKR